MGATTGIGQGTTAERSSIFERVMADPRSRHAYFNTTRGVLTGNPDQEETQELRSDLNARAIAHLFSPDRTLPRPVFNSGGTISIGADEIAAATSRPAK